MGNRGKETMSGDLFPRLLCKAGVRGAWWFLQRTGSNGEHVLRNGRASVRADYPRFEIGAEWQFPTRHCILCLRFEQGGDYAVMFTVAIPFLFGVWLHFNSRHADRIATRLCAGEHQWSTELGIRMYTSERDPFVSWKVFMDPGSWERTRPRWRDGTWHPLDWLFGNSVELRKELLRTEDVQIPLPEGSYSARVEFRKRIFGRRRWPWWPFRRVIRSAEVEPEFPLPVPGKGTSYYNIEEDAIHSLYAGQDMTTVSKVIGHVVETVLRARERYGCGAGWRPEQGPHGTETTATAGV